MKCAVAGCSNCTGNGKSGFSGFHRFPKDKDLCRQWVQFCGKKADPATARICSDHFQKDDFEGRLQFEMGLCKTMRLKAGAVPTVVSKVLSPRKAARLRLIEKRENKKIVEQLLKESMEKERETEENTQEAEAHSTKDSDMEEVSSDNSSEASQHPLEESLIETRHTYKRGRGQVATYQLLDGMCDPLGDETEMDSIGSNETLVVELLPDGDENAISLYERSDGYNDAHTISFDIEQEKQESVLESLEIEVQTEHKETFASKQEAMEKQIQQLELEEEELKKEHATLRENVKQHEHEMAELKRQIKRTEAKAALYSEMLSSLFTPNQIRKLMNGGKRVTWSAEDISRSTRLFLEDPHKYRTYLERNVVPLPSIRTVQHWMQHRKVPRLDD